MPDLSTLPALPEEENLGPAMKELNELQRRWVFELVKHGGSPTDAARAAGYGEGAPDKATADNRIRVAGFRLARNPRVQQAIREEAGHRLFTGALIGANVLMEIAADPTHKDRLKAAKLLLEHNGYQIIAEQNINVNHTATDTKAVVARITEMAERLGLDAKVLLGRAAPVDAEFVAVQTVAPAPTSEGLEDLL